MTSDAEIVVVVPFDTKLIIMVTAIAAISPKRITFSAISEAVNFLIAAPFRHLPGTRRILS